MLCGIRSSREGQSSYNATFSFIMAHIKDTIDKETNFVYMFGHNIHFEMKSL